MKIETTQTENVPAVVQPPLVRPLPDIATHFAQALADGRFDDSPRTREMRFGRHEEKRCPSDPLPKGMKFGGQIPMDDSGTNAGQHLPGGSGSPNSNKDVPAG
jgi:hypothetical protein